MAPESRVSLLPGTLPGRMPLQGTTTQPARPIVRPEQWGKYFCYLHQIDPLVAGTTGIRNLLQLDGDSDFRVMKVAALALDANGLDQRDDKVRFETSPLSETFNFVPFYVATLGAGRYPLIISPSIQLPRLAIWTAVFDSRNLAGTNTSIFIAHHGAKTYRSPIARARSYDGAKPFGYVINFTSDDGGVGPIGASLTALETIRTDGDSDFEVQKLVVTSDAPVRLQIMSDNDLWFHQPLRSELLGGNTIASVSPPADLFPGETPFILPAPRLITAGGYVTVTVTNLDAVHANRLQLVLWGQRLYPAGGR